MLLGFFAWWVSARRDKDQLKRSFKDDSEKVRHSGSAGYGASEGDEKRLLIGVV